MPKTPIGDPLRRDLESALATDEFKEAFERLKKQDEVFGIYPTVAALVDLCRPGAPDPEGRDRVLGAVLRALRGGNAIFPLLHLMFWESLIRLFARLAKSSRDPESLFEMIQLEFLQAATVYDVDRFPRKVDVNLFLNARRGVLEWRRREMRKRESLREIGEMERAGLPWRISDEEPVPPGDLEAFLLDLLGRGVLERVQYEVLLEADIYKRQTVREWALTKGIPFPTAHKRRQQAYRVIRAYLGVQ